MLTDFQFFFTLGLCRDHVNELIIKGPSHLKLRRYPTLWNVNVRKLPTIWNNCLI